MIRGTTPTFVIKTNLSSELIKEVWITFSTQNYEEIFTKKLCDCAINEDAINLQLSQEDTLNLNPQNKNDSVYIQMRILTNDGGAFASKIQAITIGRILKEGCIYAD